MKGAIIIGLLFVILVSCYQYAEYKKEIKPVAIDVPIIKPADLLDTSFRTGCETISVSISQREPTVSQAITNSIIKYMRNKKVNVTRVSAGTIYRILNTIPRRSFVSRNRNKVYIGETFAYRMPKVIYVKIITDDYYLVRERIFGRDNLTRAISFRWLKSYEANVFDCSEMSAFLEFWLERYGFNADIVADHTHSWVLVEIEPGNWIAVEATGYEPSIMPWRKYNNRFKDIYMTIQHYSEEYDWWNSIMQGEGVIGR
jgi:hypothetical protein